MNQKLSDWASIAEIVSGIAVIVTLVFLILGVRENTEITRVSMYERSVDSLIRFRTEILSDPELTRLLGAFLDNELAEIEGLDSLRLRQMVFNFFQIYEKAYFADKYGVLGQAEWSRFEVQICLQYSRAVSAQLADALRVVLTADFMEYIEVTCTNRV